MVFRIVVLLAISALASAGTLPQKQSAAFAQITAALTEPIDPRVDEDAYLDVEGLVTKYGYPVESHEVQTEDGYLLTMQRIPYGKGQDPTKDRPVIFIMHGLLSSSADWVVMGPDSGFGYYLADEGYDVWMGNARGNFYSRKHISLDPDKDSSFWKFSWHEIGVTDLPAMIDYALAATGKSKLHYAGHSQGTTSFFVMAAVKPAYNDKIITMQALAPIAYMSNMKSPLVRLLAPIANTIELLTSLIGVNEFLPSSELMAIAGDLLCKDNALFQPVCSNIMFLLCGFDPELMNSTMLPVILAHTPAGASSKQLVHYGQEQQSAHFRQYDHGTIGNLLEYGKTNPPDYSLKDISAPVFLHYSDNDWMAATVDVDQLNAELGNSYGKYRVPFDEFNHLDYLWAINVRGLVYSRVVNLMKSFD